MNSNPEEGLIIFVTVCSINPNHIRRYT